MKYKWIIYTMIATGKKVFGSKSIFFERTLTLNNTENLSEFQSS